MKKFIVTILYFLAFSTFLYIVLLLFWGEFASPTFKPNLKYKDNSIGQMNHRLAEIHDYKNIDVLFVGSSAAYRGFDTRIFYAAGLSSFNLGSSAQTPLQTEYLLQRYFNEINPKILIIDVNPLMFSIDGIESSLDIISNDKFNPGMLKMAITVNNLKIYNTLIFSIYKNLLFKNKHAQDYIRNEDTYIPGGYVESKLSFHNYESYESSSWEFSEKQFNRFQAMISYVKDTGTPFILVQTPLSPIFYTSHTNNQYFDEKMNSIGRYLNFNTILTMDDSLHFKDEFHLNQIGVEIYNKKLISFIESDLVE